MGNKFVKVKSVFHPADWTDYVRYDDLITPLEVMERLECECQFSTYSPFEMLQHLKDKHGVSELEAIFFFVDRKEDWSLVGEASARIKKSDPTPSEFHGKRVLTEIEWLKQCEAKQNE